MKTVLGWLLCLALSLAPHANACSDILVTPGASEDGSAMIAYNADDVSLFGYLYHYPATSGKQDEMVQIYEWDSGKHLGQIPQANQTFNVVGNGNEMGLVIGESTFGGLDVLSKQNGAIIDYGSMIYLALQRSKTARGAIYTMANLMDTYGYFSEGESISIADSSGEVWIMEVIGCGDTYTRKGAVWVAQKVPDGYITAHANQARITTFPRDDPENCIYSPDVVEVAIHYGLYPADKDPLDFSFSDTYDPVSFTTARFSEARVWSILSQVADDTGDFQVQFQDYAAGRNLTTRMPLFVKPYKKLSSLDVMNMMNSHYEGTELDGTKDVGGGVFGDPHRPRPLTWDFAGKTYFNERTVAIERTGWNFVAQIRPDMPLELAVLIWFGCDDSSTAPRVPVYASSTRVADPYAGKGTQDGAPAPMMKLDMTKAFWVQNMVSNLVYWRWKDAYPILRERLDDLHQGYLKLVKDTDKKALDVSKEMGRDAAIEYVTNMSVKTGEELLTTWLSLYGELFVRFRDFSTIVADKENERCGCKVLEPGLGDALKERIVRETGTHYEVGDDRPEGPTTEAKSRLGAPQRLNTQSSNIKQVY
eukprot:Nitzschia sp. Nitz4//scaffold9_size221794//2765//4634//NITZ4_001310-RA/size221794-processed-gene-0.299-mRNA-1//-1//CDS//3329560893//4222//frame0